MKIVKFTKLKDNRYELLLDNDLKLTLYDDIIVKYNLLFNKELDSDKVLFLSNENERLKAYYMSLKYITKKLRSTKEIKDYLDKHEVPKDIIDETITRLLNTHVLNDEVFTKAYISDQLSFTLKGPYKITKELIELGISEDLINQYLDYNDPIFKEHANKVIEKKIKANHKYSKNNLKNRLSNDLFNLGYDKNDFDLGSVVIDDTNFLKNEYDKLYKKYQFKDNRDYLIKQKLYQKGFNIDDINKIIK